MRFWTAEFWNRPYPGRAIEALILLAAAACLSFAFLVHVLAWRSDEAGAGRQREAVRDAVEESRPIVGEFRNPEQTLELLERNSGVKGLRLESDPAQAGPNAQTLVDRKGRIIAWLGFDPERPVSQFFNRLWPLTTGLLLMLAGIAALLIWQLRLMVRRVSDSNAKLAQIEKLDQTTGLPDHRRLLELLDAALARRSADGCVVVADLDLDRFADINDGLGHDVGDGVLAAFGQRLQASLPDGAFCGRLVGDEFMVVVETMDFAVAMHTLNDVLALVSRPAWIGGRAIQVGASGGVVQAPAHGTARDELIRKSNIALRAAKRSGRGRLVVFEPGMDSDLKNRRAIERDLKRAIAEETLDLHYQPIVAAGGSGIVGVEALLRWHHPQEGAIPPPVFVTLAEQAGLMDALGEFVLRRALTDAKRWPGLYISVNVSPLQVRDRTFVQRVDHLLREVAIPSSRLVIEITESVLIEDPEEAKARLDALRALGVRIALDDFGTGFSSLSYLQRFTFDKLKIDKGFVAPLGRAANSGAMIQAIVALGNALGLSIVAEGVETDEQRVLLRLAGCHEMQGFLFSKAVPCGEIDDMLYGTKAGPFGRTGLSAG